MGGCQESIDRRAHTHNIWFGENAIYVGVYMGRQFDSWGSHKDYNQLFLVEPINIKFHELSSPVF